MFPPSAYPYFCKATSGPQLQSIPPTDHRTLACWQLLLNPLLLRADTDRTVEDAVGVGGALDIQEAWVIVAPEGLLEVRFLGISLLVVLLSMLIGIEGGIL